MQNRILYRRWGNSFIKGNNPATSCLLFWWSRRLSLEEKKVTHSFVSSFLYFCSMIVHKFLPGWRMHLHALFTWKLHAVKKNCRSGIVSFRVEKNALALQGNASPWSWRNFLLFPLRISSLKGPFECRKNDQRLFINQFLHPLKLFSRNFHCARVDKFQKFQNKFIYPW